MTEEQTGGMPLENEETVCPADGVQPEAADPCAQETQDDAASASVQDEQPENAQPEAPAEPESQPEAPKKKPNLPLILGIAITALVIIIALLVVRIARSAKPADTDTTPAGDTTVSDAEAPADGETPADTDDTTVPDDSTGETDQTEEPAGNGISYTIAADDLTDEVLNETVAECGDDRLTNRDLPYYYWQQYYSFTSNYGSYASYFIDSTQPFDQQMCVFDDTLTWQQYFLEGAISTYENISALWQDARLAGFQLGEEDKQYLDELSNNLSIAAAAYGYDSADTYLQTAYGPAATMSGYRSFIERYLTASSYLQSLVDAKTYTEDDISAYYDANADGYAASDINKDDTKMVNVRHILITPTEQDEEGNYTDAAWAEAEKKAQDLLAEWQSGEHTEDSFALMATENSADTGSASNGGLYEEVYPGQMVTEFDAWCFDAARKPGDTGIVKTSYGYHVMYFSSVCEHPYWYVRAESDYLNMISAECAQEISDKYTAAESVDNAALVDILQN